MRKIFLLIFIFNFFGFSPAIALASDEKIDFFVICRLGKIIRTIRVSENDAKDGCVTTYTKGGIDRSVGTARHFASCKSFLENVQRNLEEASWKCRNIEKASMSVNESE